MVKHAADPQTPVIETAAPIGVIADTHGWLRDEALRVLDGCALIVHLGDVGEATILERLRALAPLYTVRGNIDTQAWAVTMPETQQLMVNGWRLHLVHNIADFDTTLACDGVLHGHSHKPRNEWRAQEGHHQLWFNPGGAGKRRFKLPITVGKLWADARGLRGAIVHPPLHD